MGVISLRMRFTTPTDDSTRRYRAQVTASADGLTGERRQALITDLLERQPKERTDAENQAAHDRISHKSGHQRYKLGLPDDLLNTVSARSFT